MSAGADCQSDQYQCDPGHDAAYHFRLTNVRNEPGLLVAMVAHFRVDADQGDGRLLRCAPRRRVVQTVVIVLRVPS